MLSYSTLPLCMLLMIFTLNYILGGHGAHAMLLDSAALHATDDIKLYSGGHGAHAILLDSAALHATDDI